MDREEDMKEQELSTPPSDEIQPNSERVPQSAPNAPAAAQEPEWISGFKLFTIMTAITLVCFLMLLDTSIVVTARIKALVSFRC
jgi:hypothetical protein